MKEKYTENISAGELRAWNDLSLWEAYHAGNLTAFGILFKRHQLRLLLIVNSWTRDPEAARDIVQEVYLKILEKGSEVAHIRVEDFLIWATQFARNIWRSNARNARRRSEIVAEEIRPYVSQSCRPQEGLDTERIFSCLRRVRNPSHRRILVLVYQGYKNPEIAERLNRSTKWVKDNRCLAKKAFREILEKEGLYQPN